LNADKPNVWKQENALVEEGTCIEEAIDRPIQYVKWSRRGLNDRSHNCTVSETAIHMHVYKKSDPWEW
jgi:hypothetical protein